MGNITKTPEQDKGCVASQMAEEYADLCVSDAYYAPLKAGFLAGYQAAKDQLADTGKVMPQWISVKEQLSEEGKDVLVFGQYLNDIPKVLGVRFRYKGDQDWKYTWEGSDEWIDREEVITHWMPLPESPEKE